jgi:hypothetical protein
MNKTGILALLALSAGLSGCATKRTTGDVDPELGCRDRTVWVNHGPAFLIAYPEYIEVCAGRTITVEIRPSVGPGQAQTMQAGGEAVDWLDGRNGDEGTGRGTSEIHLVVRESAAEAVYKYSIRIAGVGTLDPRVRVVRR